MYTNVQYSNNDRGTKKYLHRHRDIFPNVWIFPPYLLAVVLRLCSLKSFLPYLKKRNMASHTPSFYSNLGCNLENRFIFSSRCGLKLSFPPSTSDFENESSERKKFSWESFDSFMTGKEVDRSSLSFYGDKQKVITMLFFRE